MLLSDPQQCDAIATIPSERQRSDEEHVALNHLIRASVSERARSGANEVSDTRAW